VKEKDFQKQVLDLAATRGWHTAHFGSTVKWVKTKNGYKVVPDSQAAGFPDLVMARKGRLVFAELKVGRNKPSELQKRWLWELGEVDGVGVYLWTPDDWDEIEGVLA
jgi:hypothetical protein